MRVAVRIGRRRWDVPPATILGAVAALGYLLYGLGSWPDEAKELTLRINGFAAVAAPRVFVSGIGSLLLFALYGWKPSALVALAMVAAVVGQQALVLRSSTWVVERRPSTDGAWIGVMVPQGPSTVELRYVCTAAFWGMLVSCVTAWSIGCAWTARRRRRAAPIGATVWQRSLYEGRHLGTQYTYSSEARIEAR